MFMKLVFSLAVFAVAAIVKADANTDYYCSKELTCGEIPNIMCNRKAQFPPKCRDPEYVPINEALMNMFLDRHNIIRNHHALGKTGGAFNGITAADMGAVGWNDELEFMSFHSAAQCQMVEDNCRRTFNYKNVGQNTHAICNKRNHVPLDGVVTEAIDTWFSEHKNVPNLEIVQKFNSIATSPTKRFTQLVQSNADRIGCSIVRYTRPGSHSDLKCTVIGCNYSAGNTNGLPVYKLGAPTSECQKGKHSKYPGLCNSEEEYTKHEHAKTYFTNAASPVVLEWVKNKKQL